MYKFTVLEQLMLQCDKRLRTTSAYLGEPYAQFWVSKHFRVLKIMMYNRNSVNMLKFLLPPKALIYTW